MSFFELRLFGFSLVKTTDLDHTRTVSDARRRAHHDLIDENNALRTEFAETKADLDFLESVVTDLHEVNDKLLTQVATRDALLSDAIKVITSQITEILDQSAHIDVLEDTIKEVDSALEDTLDVLDASYNLSIAYEAEAKDLRERLKQTEAALEGSQRFNARI